MDTNAKALVNQIITTPMVTLFARPRRIEGGEGMRVYVEQFNDAIASIRPNRDELERVWQQIRMDEKQKTWPLPGEVCERIKQFRGRQAQAEQRYERLAEPVDEPLTAAEEAEFQDCVRRLRANPDAFLGGKALLRMAEHFERQ